MALEEPPLQHDINQGGRALRPWWLWLTNVWAYVTGEDVNRVTDSTTLTPGDNNVFANTDSAAITITLPAGVDRMRFRIVNTGTSANDVTVTPNGTEKLIGVNSDFFLKDGEALIIVYEQTDGWY